MEGILFLVIGALKITLLDIVLSGDNIGVIALATKDLPEKFAKRAAVIGVSAAIILRIIFASCVTLILNIQWLPIKLIGGLLLIKITWDFIKGEDEEEDVKVESKFWGAVWSIIIADITMSLDNVLAIAGTAEGNIPLIIFGLALNIPIIFFGSRYVAKIMNKYPIAIYIGGGILAHTAFKMLLEDRLIIHKIPHSFLIAFPYAMALLTLAYGLYITRNSKDLIS
ncbi:TerC family protein [Clostridium lundense]|uniref:TerC family protein n=1 Tax=Clostridium lundense TaxID=319475 RepID=UPI000483DA8E|nr:TerC family protein [Clostridium lundense]